MTQIDIDPMTMDPEAANAAMDKILEEEVIIEEPPNLIVELPGGWISPSGEIITTAEVRELTGEDEEALSRGGNSSSMAKYLSTIMSRATVAIGPHKPDYAIIQSLLTGDRMALLIGIRRATYGDDMEMAITCPSCEAESEIAVELDKDIPVREMEDRFKRTHEVKLRKGTATVRFMNVADYEAAVGDGKRTIPEQNTIVLSRCVTKIGNASVVTDDTIRKLGLKDRESIMTFLVENSPGPLLGEVSVPCSNCGESSPLPLSIEDFFRY